VECVIFEDAPDKVKGDVLRLSTCTSLHLLLDMPHSSYIRLTSAKFKK
jgi:hypothetical protein